MERDQDTSHRCTTVPGETRGVLISHSSFLRGSFATQTRAHGLSHGAVSANESDRGKYSGSWLTGTMPVGTLPILLPAFTSVLRHRDWHQGSRIQLQQRNCFRISRNSFHPTAIESISQRTKGAHPTPDPSPRKCLFPSRESGGDTDPVLAHQGPPFGELPRYAARDSLFFRIDRFDDLLHPLTQ